MKEAGLWQVWGTCSMWWGEAKYIPTGLEVSFLKPLFTMMAFQRVQATIGNSYILYSYNLYFLCPLPQLSKYMHPPNHNLHSKNNSMNFIPKSLMFILADFPWYMNIQQVWLSYPFCPELSLGICSFKSAHSQAVPLKSSPTLCQHSFPVWCIATL